MSEPLADLPEGEGRDEAAQAGYVVEPRERPAQISLVYESADGRLCVFEDADGHLSAVPASRLA